MHSWHLASAIVVLCALTGTMHVESFNSGLSLKTGPSASPTAPTAAPTALQSCPAAELNNKRCNKACADCADCKGDVAKGSSSPRGSTRLCPDACPHHIQSTLCDPQLWSPVGQSKQSASSLSKDACDFVSGRDAMPELAPGFADMTRMQMLDFMMSPHGNAYLTGISNLKAYFGLEVPGQRLMSLCSAMFVEFARSLEGEPDPILAAQQGRGTICGRQFPKYHKNGDFCTASKPCSATDYPSGIKTTSTSQTAECYNHSAAAHHTAGDAALTRPGSWVLRGLLGSCVNPCVEDPDQKCCFAPNVFNWTFKCCESRACCSAGQKTKSPAAGVAVAIVINANQIRKMDQCLRTATFPEQCITVPTATPTAIRTASPTASPTANPSTMPTDSPTDRPSTAPTHSPSAGPTAAPTASPTANPTAAPTAGPTASPSTSPSAAPTGSPTASPTALPTASPTASPTDSPSTMPTDSPSAAPTAMPSGMPSAMPSAGPTAAPTSAPTQTPTNSVLGGGGFAITIAVVCTLAGAGVLYGFSRAKKAGYEKEHLMNDPHYDETIRCSFIEPDVEVPTFSTESVGSFGSTLRDSNSNFEDGEDAMYYRDTYGDTKSW